MGTFSFSKSRKKPPPQLALSEPMSKAHKILGSTPLNIDSPKAWDDASSGFSGGTAESTLHSYAGTEDDISDHRVAIASDEDWANESDILPVLTEGGELGEDSEYSHTDIARTLRKTQSSSTIRSWYDKSKQPLSVSQQTSASAIAKGAPTKAHKMLDYDPAIPETKPKKKPARLDFSSLRPGSRLARKASHPQLHTDGTLANYSDGTLKSPSNVLVTTPTTGRPREPRKIQKRQTKDGMFSPTVVSQQQDLNSTRRRRGSSSKEIPSLYDHYEQMTLRQFKRGDVMRDSEDADNERPNNDATQLQPQVKDAPKSPAKTSRAMETISKGPKSAHNRSTSTSSKATKASKASKSTDHNLQDANLQETSVLLLSSGSEDEDDEYRARDEDRASTPNRRPSADENVSPRTNPARHMSSSSKRVSVAGRRGSKRASFAHKDTYINIPHAEDNVPERGAGMNVDSRSGTPYRVSSQGTSCRTSLLSNFSNTSALTIRNHHGHIEEARAITMLPARRPSKLELGGGREDKDEPKASRSSSLPSQYESIPSTHEQLTPPLSPTSVDFYIRSAHSSIDGTGSHSRFMAVSRQEEMLLSALREKHRHRREVSISELSSPKMKQEEDNRERRKDQRTDSEVLIAEASFDFGFPAPPSAQRQTYGDDRSISLASSAASLNTVDKLSQSSIEEFNGISDGNQATLSPAPTSVAPQRSILKRPTQRSADEEQEDVILYLDQGEPSPDLSDFQEFGYLASGSFQRPLSIEDTRDSLGFPKQSSKPATQSTEAQQSDRMNRSRLGMAMVPEDGELEDEKEDVPRPDSPISPDAFPAVPQVRTTLSSMARLSAFGPAPRMNEPGWWGDDD